MTVLANNNREELKALTLDEFQALKDSIDAGVPAVIVLIKKSKHIDWMPHHQVIAEGYDIYENENKKTAIIYMYDPDCGNEEQVMTLILSILPRVIYTTGELQLRDFLSTALIIIKELLRLLAQASPPTPPPPENTQSSNEKRVRNPDDFAHPNCIAVDFEGNLYVADRDNHRIQKFSSGLKRLDTWGRRGSNGNPEPGNGDKEFSSTRVCCN